MGLGSGLGFGLGRAARQPSAARCQGDIARHGEIWGDMGRYGQPSAARCIPMSRPLHAASSSRLPPALVESSRAAKAASTLVEG